MWSRITLGFVLPVCLALAACSRAPAPVSFIAEGKPANLADWNVLQLDGRHLRPNQGVMPYGLNTPLFSDHAHKLRTLWLPAGTQAEYRADAVFEFPVGTIISKTFYYPRVGAAPADSKQVRQMPDVADGVDPQGLDLDQVRLVETRLLGRRAEGWTALPYVWNVQQTEATLARTGDQIALELVSDGAKHEPFTYVVPNENQCASCHVTQLKAKQIEPIGLKARHLNRDFTLDGQTENQLARMLRLATLKGLPPDVQVVPRAANWRDPAQPLAARARAYLDINCAHCHGLKASAGNTALSLDPFVPVDRSMGLCKPSVAAGKGTGDRLFGIVPGQPDASIMLYRLASKQPAVMMPEIGRSTVHDEGVALIRDWVASLPGHCDKVQAAQ